MKILFWIPYSTEGASNRYRVEQYLPYLEPLGIKYSLHFFWCSAAYKILYKNKYGLRKVWFFILGTLSRIFDILCIAQYDLIFIHREAYPIGGAFFETLLTLFRKPLIFDFDDAIFLSSPVKPNSFIERFKNSHKVITIIKDSKHVIAGNSYLADFARRYNNAVSIIPTSIDTDKYYPTVVKDNNEKIIIGWIGSTTTAGFLNMLEDIFITLSKKFNNIIIKIVGGNFTSDRIQNIVNKTWSLEDEIKDLRSFDIGIMPMPDNEWTRGKCAFKTILYMSMGLPCVCSPVGVNKEIIIDGINGFLADSENEWITKLSLLIEDRQLRTSMGMAGRKTVENNFSLKVHAPKFLGILQKVYCERQKE